jgi:hypothetical protein
MKSHSPSIHKKTPSIEGVLVLPFLLQLASYFFGAGAGGGELDGAELAGISCFSPPMSMSPPRFNNHSASPANKIKPTIYFSTI